MKYVKHHHSPSLSLPRTWNVLTRGRKIEISLVGKFETGHPNTKAPPTYPPIYLSIHLPSNVCVSVYRYRYIYIWVPQLVLIITNFGWFWGPILANPHILDTYRVLGHLIWTPTIVIEAAEPLMGGYLSFRYEVCDMFDDFVGVCLKRVSPKIQGYPMVNHNVPISMTILIREYN